METRNELYTQSHLTGLELVAANLYAEAMQKGWSTAEWGEFLEFAREMWLKHEIARLQCRRQNEFVN